MSHNQDRREPTTSQPLREPMHPLTGLALYAAVLASLVFSADRAWERYQEYQQKQSDKAAIESLLLEAQDTSEQTKRTTAALIERQRRSRAASRDGQWLNKNCADWRRAYKNDPLPTARREMQRHCEIYEQYLATGTAPERRR